MRHRKVARQPRAAVTGPGAKACVAAASTPQDHSTEASAQRRPDPSESSSTATAEQAATEAEILIGTTMWLARVRDWLAEVLDLPSTEIARPGAITLRRADLEAFRDGLGGAVSVLDRLTIDPAQMPPPDEPSATPDVATTGRTVH